RRLLGLLFAWFLRRRFRLRLLFCLWFGFWFWFWFGRWFGFRLLQLLDASVQHADQVAQRRSEQADHGRERRRDGSDELGPEHVRRRQRRELLERVVADERSEEHTSELQSRSDLVCRLLLEKKKQMYL